MLPSEAAASASSVAGNAISFCQFTCCGGRSQTTTALAAMRCSSDVVTTSLRTVHSGQSVTRTSTWRPAASVAVACSASLVDHLAA